MLKNQKMSIRDEIKLEANKKSALHLMRVK